MQGAGFAPEALEASVKAGHRLLLDGASSLDAIRAAVNVMEDSPLFNAGHGAVFNADGEHELDASVMDGATLDAGAVAAVRHIANPARVGAKPTVSEHLWCEFRYPLRPRCRRNRPRILGLLRH